MKTMKKLCITAAIITMTVTGCSEKKTSQNQTPPTEHKNTNNQNTPSSQPKKPDVAGGFGFDELEQALRNVGAIEEAGVAYEANSAHIHSGMQYGSIVILLCNDDAIIDAYTYFEQGFMELHGKRVSVGGMIGPYLLVSLEGSLSEEAIKAFHAVGGL